VYKIGSFHRCSDGKGSKKLNGSRETEAFSLSMSPSSPGIPGVFSQLKIAFLGMISVCRLMKKERERERSWEGLKEEALGSGGGSVARIASQSSFTLSFLFVRLILSFLWSLLGVDTLPQDLKCFSSLTRGDWVDLIFDAVVSRRKDGDGLLTGAITTDQYDCAALQS